MDTLTYLATILGVIVPVASLLTNLIPTPGSTAPSWQVIGYKLIEVLALVGKGAKAHPDAVIAAQSAFLAAQKGDLPTAAQSALAVYQDLTGQAIQTGAATTAGALLVALAFVGPLGACTPQEDAVICAADAAIHPAVEAAAGTAGGPLAAAADDAVRAAIVAGVPCPPADTVPK